MSQTGGIKAGKAFVELYAKSALSEGFRKAETQIKAFAMKVQNIGAGVMAAGSAALTPLVLSTKMFSEVGSVLNDMSQRTGVSVEELSKLGYAAKLTGTDMGGVETAVRKLQKNLAGAARGSGEAGTAFTQLGLSAEELQRKTPTEAIAEIAEKLSQVENMNIRAALAMQIFGKSGTMILPMLTEGKNGLNAMFQEAQKLGLVISTDTAKSADDLGDQLDRLGMVAKQVGFVIGSALSDEVKKAADSIIKIAVRVSAWVKENKQAVITTAKLAAGMTATGIALFSLGKIIQIVIGVVKALMYAKMALVKVMDVAQALMGPKGWLVLAASLAVAAGSVYALNKSFKSINESPMDTGPKIEALQALGNQADATTIKLKQIQSDIVDLKETPLGALGVEVKEMGMDRFEKIKQQMVSEGTWTEGYQQILDSYKKIILDQEESLDLNKQAKNIIDGQKTAQEAYNDEVSKLNELLKIKLLTQSQYNTELEKQKKILGDATRDPRIEEAKRESQTVFQNTRTPQEVYQKNVGRLTQLKQAGYLDENTYQRAMSQEKERLPKDETTPGIQNNRQYRSAKSQKILDDRAIRREELLYGREGKGSLLESMRAGVYGARNNLSMNLGNAQAAGSFSGFSRAGMQGEAADRRKETDSEYLKEIAQNTGKLVGTDQENEYGSV